MERAMAINPDGSEDGGIILESQPQSTLHGASHALGISGGSRREFHVLKALRSGSAPHRIFTLSGPLRCGVQWNRIHKQALETGNFSP